MRCSMQCHNTSIIHQLNHISLMWFCMSMWYTQVTIYIKYIISLLLNFRDPELGKFFIKIHFLNQYFIMNIYKNIYKGVNHHYVLVHTRVNHVFTIGLRVACTTLNASNPSIVIRCLIISQAVNNKSATNQPKSNPNTEKS